MKKSPYIIANWKMNHDSRGVARFFSHFPVSAEELNSTNLVICPSFTLLDSVRAQIAGRKISIGGQNMFWEKEGAYTGEVSGTQLVDANCEFVILGHSERRNYFNESDEVINKKVVLALSLRLRPIVCIGESFDEKEAGLTKKSIEQKLRSVLVDVPLPELSRVIIAYEPVWAISTNVHNTDRQPTSPEQAQVAHKFIRLVIAELTNPGIASRISVIYGGSVSADNAKDFLGMDDIDGALIGAASLDPVSLLKIIQTTK